MSAVIGRQIEELIAGSNYPAISNQDVRKLKLQLPKLQEQFAISTVLEDMDDPHFAHTIRKGVQGVV